MPSIHLHEAERNGGPAERGRNRNVTFALLCLAGGVALSACESHIRLAPDFGNAVRADQAAQIANPNAHYAGYPQPGYDGKRTALAEKRYETGKVITPTVSSTSGFAGYAPTGAAPDVDAGATAAPTAPQM